MVRRLLFVFVCSALTSLFLISTSCSPAPRRTLSQEEKTADMYWLFSQFRQHYAPLQYKQDRYQFNFDDLKNRYLQLAQQTQTNEEFYRVMHRFVAEFKDAHTSGSLSASSLPKRTQVSYLGFDGIRSGEKFVVKKLLPTISSNEKYPVKIGDEITKLDGVPLSDIVKNEYALYRHLGSDEANLTYHYPKIFNRSSLVHAFAKAPNAILTVVRAEKEVAIEVPWITKDLFDFTREQADAAKAAEKENKGDTVGAISMASFFKLGLDHLLGATTKQPEILSKLARQIKGFDFRRNFEFIDTAPSWSSKILQKILKEEAGVSESTRDEFKRERNSPANSVFLTNTTYPTLIWNEPILDGDKKPTGKLRAIGYVYLNTFSPDESDDAIVKQLKSDLKTMVSFGVKHLIIDLIDNGGGSIATGLHLAQTLSPNRLVMPEIQFKVGETWLDEFETEKMDGASDAEKEIARRVFQSMIEDQAKGQLLSQKWATETLMPFQLSANTDMPSDMTLYLLVNEMCASMCDIFTGILKDNRMATVIGTKTMGAGGNVVTHPESPNSHFTVSQTESLILRRDGSYIENNGIDPDVAIKVVDSASEKYTAVRNKAVELIMQAP